MVFNSTFFWISAVIFIFGGCAGFTAAFFIFKNQFSAAEQGDFPAQKAALETEASFLKQELSKKDADLEIKNKEITELNKLSAAISTKLETIENLKAEFRKEQENTFKSISQEVLESKIKNFNEQSGATLLPLKTDLENFNRRVNALEQANRDGQTALKTQITGLLEQSLNLKTSADSLTSALKGDSSVKGAWGEVTIYNILSDAGLKEGVDFLEQKVEGSHRLDILLKLPHDNWIVIDSKTTFENYMNYASCEENDAKENYLKAHVKDIKKTVDELSKKEYHRDINNASSGAFRPNYTLMFVNPKAALDSALAEDKTLLSYAWNREVVLVDAQTVINTIEIVKRIWNIEKQREEMESVIEMLRDLNSKFTFFLANFSTAESKARETIEAMSTARNYIDGNKGAILPVINKIQTTFNAPEISDSNRKIIEKASFDYNGKGGAAPNNGADGMGGIFEGDK